MTRTGARIYRGTARNIAMLAGQLRAGELVAVPTETVYGLAANALDARACRRIFAAKGRPANDPLIVHIHRLGQLDHLTAMNPAARRLADAFWPGPLTLVLPKQPAVPDLVTSGLPSVAVRMPRHPLLRRLLRACGLPLAAPSANPFGYVSPTTAEHVRAGLGGKIRHILDGGPARIGLESTIVDVRDPRRIRVLRPGAISMAQLRDCLQQPIVRFRPQTKAQNLAQIAPGMLTRHYSPKAHILLRPRITARDLLHGDARTACVFFQKPAKATGNHIYWLDAEGDQARAARHLFALLRQLDNSGYRTILAETAPPGPMAEAINDRLRRAATKG
jgi:L-threonylcarbamoyladenylate synthase